MFWLIIIIIVIQTVCSQDTTSDGCYNRWRDAKLDCTFPIERRSWVSETECLEYCRQNQRCYSVNYDAAAQRCDLFKAQLSSGSGTSSGYGLPAPGPLPIPQPQPGYGQVPAPAPYRPQPAPIPQPVPAPYRPQPAPIPQPVPAPYRPQPAPIPQPVPAPYRPDPVPTPGYQPFPQPGYVPAPVPSPKYRPDPIPTRAPNRYLPVPIPTRGYLSPLPTPAPNRYLPAPSPIPSPGYGPGPVPAPYYVPGPSAPLPTAPPGYIPGPILPLLPGPSPAYFPGPSPGYDPAPGPLPVPDQTYRPAPRPAPNYLPAPAPIPTPAPYVPAPVPAPSPNYLPAPKRGNSYGSLPQPHAQPGSPSETFIFDSNVHKQRHKRQTYRNIPTLYPGSSAASGTVISLSSSCNGVRTVRSQGITLFGVTGRCSGSGPNPTPGPFRSTGRSTPATTRGSITDGPLPADATCSAGLVERFLEIEGFELDEFDDVLFETSDSNACRAACLANRHPNGAQIPCRSAEFNSRTRQCRVTMEIILPRGLGEMLENRDVTYHEKICVDDILTSDCRGPFRYVPQSMLVGFAETVVDAADLNECLEQCLDAQNMFGFECRSGMIFYTEDELNCVLNQEDAATQPGALSRTEDEIVDYFETHCASRSFRDLSGVSFNNVLSSNRDWGSWTSCWSGSKVQVRFRHCAQAIPNSCLVQRRNCPGTLNFEPTNTKSALDLRFGRSECNIWSSCCALLGKSGRKDCSRGRHLTRFGPIECRPTDC